MKYTGQFRNINNELYTVNIVTENNLDRTTNITLSSSPIIISTNSDGLFSPLKSRTATITIVSDTYYFDMYNSTAQGTKVEILKENNFIFVGYLTPNTYNQTYEGIDSIEIEAIEALSSLEYFKYETENRSIISFYSLIKKCLLKCNSYSCFYIPNSIHFDTNNNSIFIENAYINENNFFDNDAEQTPWTFKNVLSELCLFLGCTCTVYDNEVYFIDYNHLNNQYIKYNINNDSQSSVILSSNYIITKESYKSNNTNISLDETYNQISIKDNFYFIKELLPEMFNDSNLVKINNGYSLEKNNNTTKNIYKLYYNNKFRNTFSEPRTHTKVNNIDLNNGTYDETFLKQHIGCFFSKFATFQLDNKPSKLNFDNMLVISLGTDNQTYNNLNELTFDLMKDVEVLSINTDYSVNTVYKSPNDKQSYIILSGKYFQTDSFLFDSKKSGDKKILSPIPVFHIQIKIDNKYFTKYGWVTLEFWQSKNNGNIPYLSINVEGKNTWYEWLNIENAVKYTQDIEEEGLLIPISNTDNLSGKIEFKLFRPWTFNYGAGGQIYRIPKYVFFKDLNLKLLSVNTKQSDNKIDSDVKYINVIDEDFINEFSDLELKINTQTEKGYSYSSVLYLNSENNLDYLNNVYNNDLSKKQLQEEHLIEKYYNHFCTPKKILELTIENKLTPYSKINETLLNSSFVLDSCSIDLEQDIITAKIIEL